MFKREFRINLKSLIIWISVLLFTYILIFAVYPYLINEDTKNMLTQMMETMPKEILASFNMDIVGIESAYGWFKTEGYTFLTLIGGLYAEILGSTILVKEENDKTIEFLLSKPVSRNKVVSAKILCGILNIIIFISVIGLGNFTALKLLLYLMLFFITIFMSSFFKKTKKSMSAGMAIVFISYFMQIIGTIGENIKFIKDISLFEFVSSRYIILNGEFNLKYILIGFAIIFICIIGLYKRYNTKEFI